MTITNAAWVVIAILAGTYLWLKMGKGMIVLIILAVLLIGVWMLVHSVQNFTSTVRVATVKAVPITNLSHMMAVSITTYDSTGKAAHETYEVPGDLWEMDASVVNYASWVNLIGMNNGYQLNRITGQCDGYDPCTVKPVSLSNGNPTFSIPFLERSRYWAGVVMPSDGIEYHVFVTPQGSMYAVHA